MTRTKHTRGAIAKTERARSCNVEAVADVAEVKAAARPSILDELGAAPRGRSRWEFTPEQLADIEQVFAAERAGTIACSYARLAAIMKARYDLPWAVATIHNRLLEMRAAL